MKFVIKGNNPHLEYKVITKTALNEHASTLSISSQSRFISCNLGVCQSVSLKLDFVAELTAQLYVHLKTADSYECAGKGRALDKL